MQKQIQMKKTKIEHQLPDNILFKRVLEFLEKEIYLKFCLVTDDPEFMLLIKGYTPFFLANNFLINSLDINDNVFMTFFDQAADSLKKLPKTAVNKNWENMYLDTVAEYHTLQKKLIDSLDEYVNFLATFWHEFAIFRNFTQEQEIKIFMSLQKLVNEKITCKEIIFEESKKNVDNG